MGSIINFNMSEEKSEKPFVSIALFNFSDAPSWHLALDILTAAGIPHGGEGGMGRIEICVRSDQADFAFKLLKKDPKLIGKFISPDDLPRGSRP